MAARSGERGKSRATPIAPSRADLDGLNSPESRGEFAADGSVDLSGRDALLYRHRFFVNRAFAWKDVYYTRENADAIEQLPKEIIDAKIADGSIVDNHAQTGE